MNHYLLTEVNVWSKLSQLDDALHFLLDGGRAEIPENPGRDVEIRLISQLPPKKGLSSVEGQARLLHDLASIELQAMELGLRTLSEYPEAPALFREQLAAVTREEGYHLSLCLKGLEQLGRPWGTYPAHTGLWQAVRADEDLIDRVILVHRYLEGSGLDASESLLNRLKGVQAPAVEHAVQVIARDEVAHVQFGSDWFRKLCETERVDPDEEFGRRLWQMAQRVPRRMERIRVDTRKAAGFSEAEIEHLREFQGR